MSDSNGSVSRIFALAGRLVAGLVVLGFAGALGALVALMTRDVYIPVLVPLALGAGVGGIAGVWIYVQPVRSRLGAGAVAIVAWFLALGVFHFVEYRVTFVRAVRAEVALDTVTASLSDDEALARADAALIDAVGQDGILGFLQLRARSGVRWRTTGQASTGYLMGLLFWGVDVMVGLWLVMRVSLGVRRRRTLAAATL